MSSTTTDRAPLRTIERNIRSRDYVPGARGPFTFWVKSQDRAKQWGWRDKVVGSLTDARKVRSEREQGQREKKIAVPTSMTFGGLLDEWLDIFAAQVQGGRKSIRSLELYLQLRRTHLGDLEGIPLQDLREEDLAEVFKRLLSSGKAAAPSNVFAFVRTVIRYACRMRYIVINPIEVFDIEHPLRPVRVEKQPFRILEPSEVTTLIDGATDYQDAALMGLCAYAGLRPSEAIGLTWSDLDLNEGVITVQAQLSRATATTPAERVRTKSKSGSREVDIVAPLAELLRKHRVTAFGKGRAKATDWVFSTSTGRPKSYRQAFRILDGASARAGLNYDGVTKLSWGDLRHSAISTWISEGMDPVTAADLAGHSRASMTLDIYARSFKNSKRNERRQIMDAAYATAVGS